MNLIKDIFSKKIKAADNDFVNPVTTDLHSHFIPGIDDGIQSVDEGMIILKELEKLGYKKVITTPHVMADFYKNGPHNILPGLDLMRAELKNNNMQIKLDTAAEYMVDDQIEEKIERKELLTFGKNYVLIELPFSNEPSNLKNVLFSLQINNYQPVLAHPERYAYMANQKKKYEELAEAGILLQLNIFSLVGYYSPAVEKAADYLVKQKLVNLIGSDIHIPLHLSVLSHVLKSRKYQELCELNLLNNQL